MKEKLKRALFVYQKLFFYAGIANGEAKKPLANLNDVLLLLTFLSVRGFEYTTGQAISFFFGIIILSMIVGKVIVALGIVAYNQRMVNSQNQELLNIIERLERIEKKL